MRTVQVERVFTGTTCDRYCHGRLLNEAGSEVWRCKHRHRTTTVAQRCSDAERRRWVRSGKGRA